MVHATIGLDVFPFVHAFILACLEVKAFLISLLSTFRCWCCRCIVTAMVNVDRDQMSWKKVVAHGENVQFGLE